MGKDDLIWQKGHKATRIETEVENRVVILWCRFECWRNFSSTMKLSSLVVLEHITWCASAIAFKEAIVLIEPSEMKLLFRPWMKYISWYEFTYQILVKLRVTNTLVLQQYQSLVDLKKEKDCETEETFDMFGLFIGFIISIFEVNTPQHIQTDVDWGETWRFSQYDQVF